MKDAGRYVRTDLAVESGYGTDIAAYGGIKYTREEHGTVLTEKITADTKESAALLGKERGTYITLSFGKVWQLSDTEKETVISELERNLSELIASCGAGSGPVLVCGLGNRLITPDAVGPRAVDAVLVTRHLTGDRELFSSLSHREVAAVCPGVVGQTGIETAELIRGAAERISPSVVLAVDALASRSTERLASTLQLCDTGISPGSGIGNVRAGINKETLGFPVIAIGVPTVVSSSTLVYDVLGQAGITEPDERIKQILEQGQSFFVSPKESDAAVAELSEIISSAINRVLSLRG